MTKRLEDVKETVRFDIKICQRSQILQIFHVLMQKRAAVFVDKSQFAVKI